jgi:hypothetical protein
MLSKIQIMMYNVGLVFLAMLMLVVAVFSTNLLLIGDSFDRNSNQEWCRSQMGSHKNYTEKARKYLPYGIIWGDVKLSLSENAVSPLFCRNELNDTVAGVHIFGSSLIKPYYNNKISSTEGTQFRVVQALQDYFNFTGILSDK